jgi:hypothetical protein
MGEEKASNSILPEATFRHIDGLIIVVVESGGG